MTEPIRTEALHKRFGRNDALRGVDLAVPQGAAYAFIGSNGAGKTTTLRILVNLMEASSGAASVLGVDSRKLGPAEFRRVGYVAESQEMPSRLRCGEYLAYLRPFYPAWDSQREDELVRKFALPLDRKIGQLSHGMRIKMGLTAALAFRPEVLILDEPLSGLDPLVRDEFLEGLIEQAGEMTILISSHELTEIEGMVTHAGFLEGGRMLFQESMADLSSRFRLVRVKLDSSSRDVSSRPNNVPSEWLDFETSGGVAQFVDSSFREDSVGERVRSLLGGVRGIDAEPMPLRSIFTALAREARKQAIPREA